MAVDLLIGAAVSAGVFYVWGWRRFRYLRAHWRSQQRTAELEAALREARDELTPGNPFRAATAADADLVELLRVARADGEALVACGFTPLGELVIQPPQRAANRCLRAFVDAAGTTCAVLVVTRKWPGTARLQLLSYAGDEVFATRRGPWPSLAERPSVHVQTTVADLAIERIVAQHRASARAGVGLRSCDELLAALGHAHELAVQWRLAQPPDELLDADLRGVLGAHYDRLGKAWARRMRSPLPEATVRRR